MVIWRFLGPFPITVGVITEISGSHLRSNLLVIFFNYSIREDNRADNLNHPFEMCVVTILR